MLNDLGPDARQHTPTPHTKSLTGDLSPAPRILKANDTCLANRGAEEVQPLSSEIVTVLELGGEERGIRIFNLAGGRRGVSKWKRFKKFKKEE